MSTRFLLATLLLLMTLQPGVRGQESASPTVEPVAPPPNVRATEAKGIVPGLELALFDPCEPVTWGSPEVVPGLWQRTWGLAGINGYAVGSKMAPNGVPFDPLFSLDLLLNVALTQDRECYLFVKSQFWGQKAADGVTNPSQGGFDFSKRQFDLDAGIAWNYEGRLEARVFAYSNNNLNRGVTLDKPFGYNDGVALENRYYLPSTNFDKGLYRFVGVGYYFTKDKVGADGRTFKPSLFLDSSLAFDIVPDSFYAYADVSLITKRPVVAKLLLADVGLALRPFASISDLEFRIGADNNFDLEVGKTRTLFYGNVRIVW